MPAVRALLSACATSVTRPNSPPRIRLRTTEVDSGILLATDGANERSAAPATPILAKRTVSVSDPRTNTVRCTS